MGFNLINSRLRLIDSPRDQVILTRLSGEIYLPKILLAKLSFRPINPVKF